jgi:hypothetical protein
MNIEEITNQLYTASQESKACRVSLQSEPLPRLINPYGVCQSARNQIVLVCWQTAGFTKAGGKEGYRNLQLSKIIEVEMLDTHFQKRDDFNPTDVQYKDWVFHI